MSEDGSGNYYIAFPPDFDPIGLDLSKSYKSPSISNYDLGVLRREATDRPYFETLRYAVSPPSYAAYPSSFSAYKIANWPIYLVINHKVAWRLGEEHNDK